jgi:molybdenum cofactor synthesis domain-containing protein
MLPPGTDAVVNVERTHLAEKQVSITGEVRTDDHVVRGGSDLQVGEIILEEGRRVRAQDIAVLASVGIAEVTVVRRPRVAILVTGDELREPGSELGSGQIYSSNGYALSARVQELGADVRLWPIIPDDLGAIHAALQEALAAADLILISGGSSVGRKDLTARALEATAGADIVVCGVAAKPGRPSIVATVGDRLVIGIPGNPFAALVSFAMFGEPALARLLRIAPRHTVPLPNGGMASGRLGASLTSRVGRQEYVLVRLHSGVGEEQIVCPLPPGTGSLSGMSKADGLLVLRPDVVGLDEGEEVMVVIH